MNRKWRAAVVGCGGIANQKHLPSLKKLADRVEVVALCDLIAERAEKAAAEYGAPGAKVYTDYRELLRDETIDIVHVCTPNRMHSEISVAALDAGKHVYCEKPMAINSAEAQKMLDAQKRSGKLLTVGHQYRQGAHNRAMKEIAASGQLGEIYYAEAHALRRRAVPNWGVFLNKYEQGGGPLVDCGSHSLDLTLWMMDNYKPKYVLGQTFNKLGTGLEPHEQGNVGGSWDNKHFEVEDSAFGMIKMENGATIMLFSSWAINKLNVKQGLCTLCGTKGGLSAEPFSLTSPKCDVQINQVIAGRLSETTLPYKDISRPDENADPGWLELKNILDALEGKAELIVKPEQAFVVTQILEAIYKSAELGRAVEIREGKLC